MKSSADRKPEGDAPSGADPLDALPSAEHAAATLSLDSSHELGDVRKFDERLCSALAERAASLQRRIAFPEADDPRILRAAAMLERRSIAEPVLLSADKRTRGRPRHGDAVPSCDPRPDEPPRADVPSDAGIGDALSQAMRMLADGAVHGVVAGATCPTADVVRAALRHVGLRAGVRTLSSCFFLEMRDFRGRGDEVLAFADPAVVPDPDAAQLAEIASETVRLRRLIVGDQPVVAFLSYSTDGSAAGPAVDKVREAARRFRESNPQVASDGEMQADVALSPHVARTKSPGSAVGGKANILVFPSLDAANIGYKLVQRLAGATASGPILQGLAAPVNDLSRGASEVDIATVAAITALMAEQRPADMPSMPRDGRRFP